MSAQVIAFPPSAVFRSAAERTYLEQCLTAARHRSANEMEAWDAAVHMCGATWEIVSRRAGRDSEART